MQQTMLALGALLILVTLTLNQQRSAFLVQKNAYLREMESATADFAEKRFHEVTANLAFDDSRVGMTILDTGLTGLTPVANLGSDSGDLDDIDDLHTVVDTTTHQLNKEDFRIRAEYSVRYIDPNDPADETLTSPTLAKELTIVATALDAIGEARATYRFQKVLAVSDFIN